MNILKPIRSSFKAYVLGLSVLASGLSHAETFGPSTLIEGSVTATAGSVVMVTGVPSMLVGEPDWSVLGVEMVAEGMKLTLRGTAETAALVVLVPAVSTAVVVGSTIQVVATAGGWLLRCGDQALGFVARGGPSMLFSEPDPCCGR